MSKKIEDYFGTISSPPPSKRKKQLPPTPPSIFAPIENNDDDGAVFDVDDADYGTVDFNRARLPKAGKRAGKTWEAMQGKFKPDSYTFTAIPPRQTTVTTKELSRFTKNLADMLINGNLRIKFSPKCATRAGAKQYCLTKLDDRGYPRFKLIGTNAKDPFGNDICDMNGDQVDDIIICDKQGNPVIINGYKLVQASPFKKIWMNIRANGETKDSFESWLSQQFHTEKDWNKISDQDWSRGKLDWDLTKAEEVARDAYNTYSMKGLGKPKLNTRLSARALWSSLYSEYLWNDVKASFVSTYSQLAPLIKCVNYLKLANAIYIISIEWEFAKTLNNGVNNYIQWFNYKQGNPKLVNKQLGMIVQQLYNTLGVEYQQDENKEQVNGVNTIKLITLSVNIISACFNVETSTNITQDIANIEQGDDTTINRYKDRFKKNIDIVVNQQVPGYLSYTQQQAAHKPQAVEGYEDYMNMTWK